jgi:transcription termination factor Rho
LAARQSTISTRIIDLFSPKGQRGMIVSQTNHVVERNCNAIAANHPEVLLFFID